MLTDELNRSADGREWDARAKHTASGLGGDDQGGHIDCYASPNVAALLNAQTARFRTPRLWEASLDRELTRGDGVIAAREVTIRQQVSIPTPTGVQYAVLCARAADADVAEADTAFGHWAEAGSAVRIGRVSTRAISQARWRQKRTAAQSSATR